MTDALLVWRGEGRHEITLNRPQRRNAINRELNAAIVAALRAFDADADARVAVLTGADPAFCAGMDLSDLSWADGDRSRAEVGDTFASALRAVRKPELIGAAEALRLGIASEVLPHDDLLPRAREVAAAVAAVDPGFLADLRAAYERRGNLGTDDALDAERAESSRREIAAGEVAARRDEVITRGHSRIQREGH
jgi:enoyl-CoA hydratase